MNENVEFSKETALQMIASAEVSLMEAWNKIQKAKIALEALKLMVKDMK